MELVQVAHLRRNVRFDARPIYVVVVARFRVRVFSEGTIIADVLTSKEKN